MAYFDYIIAGGGASGLRGCRRCWSAPATWSPASGGGLHTMDLTNPIPFVAVLPCRVADTREAAGPYGGPSLQAGETRTLVLAQRCGVPLDAEGPEPLALSRALSERPKFLYTIPVMKALDVTVFFGPTVYSVKQDLTTSVTVAEVGPPYTAVNVTNVGVTQVKKSATGAAMVVVSFTFAFTR